MVENRSNKDGSICLCRCFAFDKIKATERDLFIVCDNTCLFVFLQIK